MSERKIKFRNAMGGYNKADVNNYIESLNSKIFESESESRKKIADLEKKIKELEIEAEQKKEEEIKDLSEKLEKSDKLIVELNGRIDSLKSENGELEKKNNELAAEIEEYEKAAGENNELYEKSSKYDKISEQIGSMIVSANARAESIVSEAELKARVASKTMIDMTVEKLNGLNEKYLGEIVAKSVQFTEAFRELSLNADEFRAGTKSALEEEGGKLKESLEITKRVIMEEEK
ncbi:MAG: hypothetical protein IKU48_05740 [Clostridia bacterium]|nr:hypothetical protein [Clostridia bacterium]